MRAFGKDNPAFTHGMTNTPTYRIWAGLYAIAEAYKLPAFRALSRRTLADFPVVGLN